MMVHLMNSTTNMCKKVKLEIQEEEEGEEHSRLTKKSKSAHNPTPFQNNTNTSSAPLGLDVDEPSPLGLRLKKSPSLMDLIQMRLSHHHHHHHHHHHPCVKDLELPQNDLNYSSASAAAAAAADNKLKASNFPASLLRIGSWEYMSRHEGDLVAKCYFAKHKLVWEVLEDGLKSKIEIQWSDITSLKAKYAEDAPDTLDIVLARKPLFFRETNPQPRKHTLWQATSDFTGGQASLHRKHFLQCPHGLLSKHFEKLIQCDLRLNLLSRQPEVILDSPYFQLKASVFENPDASEHDEFDQLKIDYVSTFPGYRDASSASASLSSSSKNKLQEPVDRAPAHLSRGTPPSPGPLVMVTVETEENGGSEFEESKPLEQIKVRGLHASMSMSDLVSHIGHCISEQMTSGSPLVLGEGLQQNEDMLEEITQYLLSDSQLASTSDEKSLMTRVNSLCCLLQKNPISVQNNMHINNDGVKEYRDDQLGSGIEITVDDNVTVGPIVYDREFQIASECKQEPVMSRKDSVGDLLLHLPRIASLPQFLFNRSEDGDNRAR